MVINATEGTMLSRKLPMGWDQREKIWEDAFRMSPALKQHESEASDILVRIKEVAEDRNLLVHGLWERFNSGPPLNAGLVILKHKKGTENEIVHVRHVISINQIKEVAQKANSLNIELQKWSRILTTERGKPPLDVYIPLAQD